MKLAPCQQLREKYSLGFIDSLPSTRPAQWAVWELGTRADRSANQSRFFSRGWTQVLLPVSVNATRRRGWRSNTPRR